MTYTSNQLAKRNKIIKSHTYFVNLLDAHIVNILVNLFDNNYNKSQSIITYIENERATSGLNNNIDIISEVYGEDRRNSTLFLKIIKNGIELLHLTIHLNIRDLDAKKTGIIHIQKYIYKHTCKQIYNTLSKTDKQSIYSLIHIQRPQNKPNSLEFSIINEPPIKSILNICNYEDKLEKEIDVIITVLNRLFDEDDVLYVGDKNKIVPIHMKSNNILLNMNHHIKYSMRRNKGHTLLPQINNSVPLILNRQHNKKKVKAESMRITRKIYRMK